MIIGGKSKFACVDGPEFEAHEVDFSVLMQRNRMYREAERKSLEEFQTATRDTGQHKADDADKGTACLVAEDQQWSQ